MNKKTAPIIRQAFEMYAKGDISMDNIGVFFEANRLFGKNGKRIHRTRAYYILANPFYYGHFRYMGEIYEGKYEPIVSKKLFDKVQEVMKQKSRPRHKDKSEPQAYCGLLSCATCGMMITGEYRVKTQLNGTQHFYTYYHCTKKRRDMKCPEPCIRQEVLDEQISSLLQKVSMPRDWADYLNERLQKDKMESAQSVSLLVSENEKCIQNIVVKLQRLLDGYLDQDIDKEVYRSKKSKLLSEEKSLEEEISRSQMREKHWLEPMEKWIKDAQNIEKIALDSDLFAKKVVAKEIFGSNLSLGEKQVRASAPAFPNFPAESGQTQWDALRASHHLASSEAFCSFREYLYDTARTYFIKNS